MGTLKAKQLAQKANVNIETLRYYEGLELLSKAPRAENGYRLYGEQHLEQLFFIKQAQELGFSLTEIKELQALTLDRKATAGEIKEKALQKIENIDKKIKDLRNIKTTLQALTNRCPGELGTLEVCPILNNLLHK